MDLWSWGSDGSHPPRSVAVRRFPGNQKDAAPCARPLGQARARPAAASLTNDRAAVSTDPPHTHGGCPQGRLLLEFYRDGFH